MRRQPGWFGGPPKSMRQNTTSGTIERLESIDVCSFFSSVYPTILVASNLQTNLEHLVRGDDRSDASVVIVVL